MDARDEFGIVAADRSGHQRTRMGGDDAAGNQTSGRGVRPRIHSGRLERYLGAEMIAHLQGCMKGWYGRPICLVDVPGSVWITADGDFVGSFDRGWFVNGYETLKEYWRRMGVARYGAAYSGLAGIADFLDRQRGGHLQRSHFYKVGAGGITGYSWTLWRGGINPAAGSAPGAAPGGTALDNTSASAMYIADAASGTNRLVWAEAQAAIANQSLLIYDRLFHVLKTMASTATEAVTGVPTRYQSATATNEQFAGDNFLFTEVGGTALANTAHNWTVCQYTNEAGTTGQTLPSFAGVAANSVDIFDLPIRTWFAPLASGDLGIKALTQMQCDASVATGVINFVMGHPLGFMAFPNVGSFYQFDWLTNRDLAPLVANGACVSFIQPTASNGTITIFDGRLYTMDVP